MRLTAICMGSMIAFGALQGAGAVEPVKQDEHSLARELKETRQLVEKLSAHVKKLEQQLEAKQPRAKSAAKPVKGPAMRTVAYKVGDLVAVQGDFAVAYDLDHLTDYITTRVAPDQWERAGGPCKIAPYAENQSLVISATPELHEKVSDRLARLREAKKIREAMRLLEDFYSIDSQVSAAY